MDSTEKEVRTLQTRVIDLERQLAEAQTTILTLEGRKRAEETPQEKESPQLEKTQLLELEQARLAAILENLPVGIWIADEQGKLVGKNKQADQIWAGKAPMLNGIEEYHQYVAWHPESGRLLTSEEYPVAVTLRTGQPVEPMELKIRRFDGSEGTVLVSAAPIKDHNGLLMGAVGVNVDITDRQRTEEERRIAEERYTVLFNSVREGFAHYKAVYDDQRKIVDILVVEINPAGAKLSGVSREDQIGKTWRQVWPDLDEKLFAMYQRVDETGEIIRFDDNNRLTGRIYGVVISKIAQGEFIATFNDITDRKLAEERFNKAFHASPNALVLSHQEDGRIETVNDTFLRFFRYREEEVIGKTSVELSMFANPADRQEAVRRLKADGTLRDFELDVQLKSGEVRNASLSVEMINIGGKNMMLTTIQDITLRKKAEEQLKDYAERLERSNRELEQFAYVVSHDLQEPLRKIEIFGDLLVERTMQLDERGRDYVERMRSAAGRMRDMVEGLLQLSRVTTQGKPFVRVDLSQVTSEVLSDLGDQIRRTDGKVYLGDLPPIEGDELQLRQLMQNLISNALKYHRPDTPPEVKIYAKQSSEKVQIVVEDKGIGFEQEGVESIFQPFQRLVGRSQYEGSGLGLAICRRIVERHRGGITALSNPGQGTMFIVTLPVHQPESVRNELRKDANDEEKGATFDRRG